MDRDDTLSGPEVEDSLGYRRRGETRFTHWVISNGLELRARRKYMNRFVFRSSVNLTVSGD